MSTLGKRKYQADNKDLFDSVKRNKNDNIDSSLQNSNIIDSGINLTRGRRIYTLIILYI